MLVPGGLFPDDLDTTSLALQVLQPPSKELVSTLLNEMAEYVNQDGTFQASQFPFEPAHSIYATCPAK